MGVGCYCVWLGMISSPAFRSVRAKKLWICIYFRLNGKLIHIYWRLPNQVIEFMVAYELLCPSQVIIFHYCDCFCVLCFLMVWISWQFFTMALFRPISPTACEMRLRMMTCIRGSLTFIQHWYRYPSGDLYILIPYTYIYIHIKYDDHQYHHD